MEGSKNTEVVHTNGVEPEILNDNTKNKSQSGRLIIIEDKENQSNENENKKEFVDKKNNKEKKLLKKKRLVGGVSVEGNEDLLFRFNGDLDLVKAKQAKKDKDSKTQDQVQVQNQVNNQGYVGLIDRDGYKLIMGQAIRDCMKNMEPVESVQMKQFEQNLRSFIKEKLENPDRSGKMFTMNEFAEYMRDRGVSIKYMDNTNRSYHVGHYNGKAVLVVKNDIGLKLLGYRSDVARVPDMRQIAKIYNLSYNEEDTRRAPNPVLIQDENLSKSNYRYNRL